MPPLEPLRWGVLGAANIAVRKVIPAMQRTPLARVDAIASRDPAKAHSAAATLGIARSFGSYEALLADPELDAIYIPLPNHLHVPWSIKAAEAGKHVLCEKPIAMSANEARQLVAARDINQVQVAEAFMVRTHPQWLRVRELITSGHIGELRLIAVHFSYFRRDPTDIRSHAEWGGGALMDIGCYAVTLARWLFGAEPSRVVGLLDRDPELGTDRLTSALLSFPEGQATFTCASQLVPYQRVQLFGTAGRIEVEIPFNAPNDRPCRIFVDPGSALGDASAHAIEMPVTDQYSVQAENFAHAVRGIAPVAVPLEDAVANMEVIDALFRSAIDGDWQMIPNGV